MPNIPKNFWSNPLIERASANAKVVALWAMTNPTVNAVGYSEATPQRAAFECGIQLDALVPACEELPGILVKMNDGIWVKPYIELQYGRGQKLMSNNVLPSIIAAMSSSPKEVQDAVLEAYPEIKTINEQRLEKANPDPTEEKAKQILLHLNQKAGREFRPVPVHLTPIMARLREVNGDAQGIIAMIDRMVKLWNDDPQMRQFLTPATLFRPTKFQTYYDMRNMPVPKQSLVDVQLSDTQRLLAIKNERLHALNNKFSRTVDEDEERARLREEIRELKKKAAQLEVQ